MTRTRRWHQVAFSRDLRSELSVVHVGVCPVLLHRAATTRAFAGRCPHRGASLGHGGKVVDGSIVCPFHGLRIGLGVQKSGDFGAVREYPCLEAGGLVFVAVESEPRPDDFGPYIRRLDQAHRIVPGFSMSVRVRPELVIENAFDALHFVPVHGVLETPVLTPFDVGKGGFAVRGSFTLPPSSWQRPAEGKDCVVVPFEATAFAPGVVASSMGGPRPYTVITAATAEADRSRIFLSLAVDRSLPATDAEIDYLLGQMRTGLEQDRAIWERMDDTTFHPLPADAPVVGLRDFNQRFDHDGP